MQKIVFMVCSILTILLLVAGCTTQAPSPLTPSQNTIPDQKNAPEPGLVPPQNTPLTPLVPATTRTQNQPTPPNAPPLEPSVRKGETEPYVTNLGFSTSYFSFAIPGCDMKEIFPAIARDPEYGIEQPVPKLSSVSAAEIRSFIRDHTAGSNQNSPFKGTYGCEGVAMSPNWNFAEISAAITPRNARPARYEISLIMKSQGKNITVFTTQENLTPDVPMAFIRYIPMKTDELALLDIPYITFTLLPEPALTTPVPAPSAQPEIVDPTVLVFTPYSNQYYTLRYPEQWTVEEHASARTTMLKSAEGRITYTLTAIPQEANAWVVKTDRDTYVNDLTGDYPGYSPESIMRDFGRCSFGNTGSCMQYSVYLPDGSYAKKVFIATMHYGHVFRIQCPDERCRNLGEYMTNSITVKDTRSN